MGLAAIMTAGLYGASRIGAIDVDDTFGRAAQTKALEVVISR